MRLSLCANLDGYSVRLVDEGSDDLLATFRTFAEAAASYRATKQASHDALAMLAACLSTTPQRRPEMAEETYIIRRRLTPSRWVLVAAAPVALALHLIMTWRL